MNTVQNSSFEPLTIYKVGSLKEITVLSLPLMLSALSSALMFFFDRYILAQYSITAFNTAAAAGMSVMIFHLGGIGIAGICEVYVGQSYGAKKYHQIGSHVWQMLWFALFTTAVFLPLSFFQSWFLPERYTESGMGYFQWLMLAGPIVTANAALSGYYVGRGKVKILTTVVILANIINIALDLLFVFGYGAVPSMGTVGAAYATFCAQVFTLAVLAWGFLNKGSRLAFATLNYHFKFKSFFRAFRVGFPSAVGHMIEIAGWSVQLHIMATVSDLHVAVLAVGQTIFGLVAFTTEGLRGGVVACASNLVGANLTGKIKPTFIAALKLHLIIGILFVLPLLIYPEWLVNDFIKEGSTIVSKEELIHYATLACWFIMLYYVVDGLVWISAGFLTAIEDTWFIMIANALNAWIFAILPLYYLARHTNVSPDTSWRVVAFYGCVNMLFFLMRYRAKFGKQFMQPQAA